MHAVPDVDYPLDGPGCVQETAPPLSPAMMLDPSQGSKSSSTEDSGVDIPPVKGIPRFFFPSKHALSDERRQELRTQVKQLFISSDTGDERCLALSDLVCVSAAIGLPRYLTLALFRRAREATPVRIGDDTGASPHQSVRWIEVDRVLSAIDAYTTADITQVGFNLLKGQEQTVLLPADLEVVARDVIENHPAFEFLATSPNFQDRYIDTVVARIFYIKPRGMNGQMTLAEFRLMNIIEILNKVNLAKTSVSPLMPSLFSYKDFYVVYCKFWELDRDRDMLLAQEDLESYGCDALSPKVIERILDGYAMPQLALHTGKMTYKEFIPFIMSVEDKTTNAALEYWFRCLDLDGDGVLSLLELETFWNFQSPRLNDRFKTDDFFSVIIDLVKPQSRYQIHLRDLKRNRPAARLFLDLLIDTQKHLENLRRLVDLGFRIYDRVYMDDEDDDTTARSLQALGDPDSKGRVPLEGWEKYATRTYRELASIEIDSQRRRQQLMLRRDQRCVDIDVIAIDSIAVEVSRSAVVTGAGFASNDSQLSNRSRQRSASKGNGSLAGGNGAGGNRARKNGRRRGF
ncbi:uncharacterized protein BJ171DRAFT_15973 [Polychytrium aggregatum]|uniref:uncharacterized protein n=1 Tax=Polychytrium aggregatum TaxID=110093 RepID=UPI0022FEDE04|nr:uncharacterized protein BJ171DRAFT_15973 [Polychytrium aggregatum]KAI9206650.1 hypothetical protein BJ171DRAFT_15973 [Polychytrium aggregatum]